MVYLNIILSGGGSAGHINPAIAIAKYFDSHYENVNILFIGTKNGMENELVKKAGFDIFTVDVEGFKTSLSLKNVKPLAKFLLASMKMKSVIKKFKADMVIGTGGYVCAPAVTAANMMKIPTLIHEQNAFPGSAVRFLSKKSTVTAISFKESTKFLSGAKNIVYTGNPVRENILMADSEKAKEKLGLGNKKMVLVVGGSLGALKINDVVCDYLKEYKSSDTRFFISTGKRDYERIKDKVKEYEDNSYFEVMPYIHDMDTYLAAADLVVCRSGAITLSEICALKKASILIPSPNVTNNHQEYNASALVKNNAALMIKECDFSPSSLNDAINILLKDENKRISIGNNAYKMYNNDSTKFICESILKFVK
ncbi:MAG: undecaprenyldiphospho-muramoylpentapeptide beta-N-acetylglucosaminyltransferase [Ruminococcaceae bacterium]|nr:undecaprenyldiphospho-muramoylpentapeptide beta-N-acetylglucosaminyltransferase [Oscillospiraceae bacterium]